MHFLELEAEEFRKYAAGHPDKSFYQTPEIAKLREKNGWTTYYFGVKEQGNLKAASLIFAKPAFLGKSIFYAPGGPLLDFEDEKLTNCFIKNLKKFLKSHNGYVLHIEPYYELIERDRDGNPTENGFNREKAIMNLRNNGFKPLKTSDEPKYSFALDLGDYGADEIFSDMKRNTRGHIRKAEKMGVKIRELNREELSIFKKITESTSTRRNFQDKPLSYYEDMYDLFYPRGEVKFLLAEAEPLPENENELNSDASAENENQSKSDSDTKQPLLPLSAAMFMLYGDEVIYLFSGSDEQYMKDYNAQYLIQWHMIKYAIEHKFKRYNFYGINGLPNKADKDYGIYDFKKGFTSDKTGRVIELIGAFELPISPLFYSLHALLHKIKN